MSIIPTTLETKAPALKSWKQFQKKPASESQLQKWFSNGSKFCPAIVCGKVSDNLELIDFDFKAKWFEQWKAFIPDDLFSRLAIETSQSGGIHVIYRVASSFIIPGSLKLAQELYPVPCSGDHSVPDSNKKYAAKKISGNWFCLLTNIETKGEGGYFLCAPSPGYKLIQNDFSCLPVLTESERETLINAAMALNTVIEPEKPDYQKKYKAGKKNNLSDDNNSDTGLKPWEDYDNQCSPLPLLLDAGWLITGRTGKAPGGSETVLICRPGKKSGISGSVIADKIFYCFTSNAPPFEPGKAYYPSSVHALLLHDDNFSESAKALYRDGYGDRFVKNSMSVSGIKSDSEFEINLLNLIDNDGITCVFRDENIKVLSDIKKNERERWQILRKELKIKGIMISELEKAIREFDREFLRKEFERKKQERKKQKNSVNLDYLFWFERLNEKTGQTELKISLSNLYRFLVNKGLCKIRIDDELNKCLVLISDNIVSLMDMAEIQKIVFLYIDSLPEMISENFSKTDLKEVFSRGINSYLSDDKINFFCDFKKLNFITDTKEKSFIFFKNGCAEITGNSIKLTPYTEIDGYIWKSQIIDHSFLILNEKEYKMLDFYTFTKHVCTDRDKNIFESERHQALCETIGYMIHNYKKSYNNLAIVLSESSMSEDPHGRTGKGLIMQAVGKIRKIVNIDGKAFSFDSQFCYQEVNLDTQIIFFDDVKKFFDFQRLYSVITEGISVEKKNRDRFKFKPEDSPKIVISTNYSIQGMSESDKGRRHDMELLCYYDASFRPEHEFNGYFFDWSVQDWNKFYNFMLSNVQLWLKKGDFSRYNSDTIDLKRIINQTNREFIEYADKIERNTPLHYGNEYNGYLKAESLSEKTLSSKRFTGWLKAYAKFFNMEYVATRTHDARFFELRTENRCAGCPHCQLDYCIKYNANIRQAFRNCNILK